MTVSINVVEIQSISLPKVQSHGPQSKYTLNKIKSDNHRERKNKTKRSNNEASEDICCLYMTSRTAPNLKRKKYQEKLVMEAAQLRKTSNIAKYGFDALMKWFFIRIQMNIECHGNTYFHIDTSADVIYGVA